MKGETILHVVKLPDEEIKVKKADCLLVLVSCLDGKTEGLFTSRRSPVLYLRVKLLTRASITHFFFPSMHLANHSVTSLTLRGDLVFITRSNSSDTRYSIQVS